MNVYIVHELYHNSITKRITPFSSKKKAQEYVDNILKSAVERDNWSVEDEHFWINSRWIAVSGHRLIPPSKNVNNIEFIYFFQEEVQ